MKLKEIIQQISMQKVIGSIEINIAEINTDSREIGPAHLFIAVPGTQVDGHSFITKAIENGATAILCETLPAELVEGVTYLVTSSTEIVVGKVATCFYGNPTKKLQLIGVTGTNGKTTIATLLYQLFRQFGYKVGLLSTVCNYVDSEAQEAKQTTPDPITLNRLLQKMVLAGCEYAFMEVSSHAVAQHRISGLYFKGGIFTNLTRDHLDYHKTVENYLAAKKAFFDGLPQEAFALTNLDDKTGLVMLQNTKAKKLAYSLRSMCEFKGRILENHLEGMLLAINDCEVAVHFIGRFNASNLLAVYGAAVALGKDPQETMVALSTLLPVNGRFDTIHSPKGITAIVDYAHTPDALINVLEAIHGVLQGKGQVITVVGAGGNRDKGKRPIMAAESAKNSDRVIITSDNPRFEEPQDIINDMLEGLSAEQMKKTLSIVDRKEAIRTAVMFAQKGDVILVAGKGHENYQDVKGVKHHFDDKEILRELMELD